MLSGLSQGQKNELREFNAEEVQRTRLKGRFYAIAGSLPGGLTLGSGIGEIIRGDYPDAVWRIYAGVATCAFTLAKVQLEGLKHRRAVERENFFSASSPDA